MADVVQPAAAPGQAAQLGYFWQPRVVAWGAGAPCPVQRGAGMLGLRPAGLWAPIPFSPSGTRAGSCSSQKYPKGNKGLMLLACELERCIIHSVQRQERERRCLAKPPEWLIYP